MSDPIGPSCIGTTHRLCTKVEPPQRWREFVDPATRARKTATVPKVLVDAWAARR